MRQKKLKSHQVHCETPSINCDCGGGCFALATHDTFNRVDKRGYYCEDCGQEWVLPKDVELKVIFSKSRRG